MQIEEDLITKGFRNIDFFKFLEVTGDSRQKKIFSKKEGQECKKELRKR